MPTGIDLSLSDDELDRRRDHITEFIYETVDRAGADGAVIGLSGGIDSTTTAHLAVEALGSAQVHGLLMPSTVSDEENVSDAERVAMALGIPYDVFEIGPIVDAFLDTYPEGADDRLAAGNVRVRTRMVLDYFVANTEQMLVLGTGNRTEALVGYFTKWGDGAVDCHPIGHLYKQQVRQLARHLGVEEDLVTKTPTAGMWVGQTDEEELGIDYDMLDAILALAIDGPFSASSTARQLEGVEESEVARIVAMVERSAHKRELPPAPKRL